MTLVFADFSSWMSPALFSERLLSEIDALEQFDPADRVNLLSKLPLCTLQKFWCQSVAGPRLEKFTQVISVLNSEVLFTLQPGEYQRPLAIFKNSEVPFSSFQVQFAAKFTTPQWSLLERVRYPAPDNWFSGPWGRYSQPLPSHNQFYPMMLSGLTSRLASLGRISSPEMINKNDNQSNHVFSLNPNGLFPEKNMESPKFGNIFLNFEFKNCHLRPPVFVVNPNDASFEGALALVNFGFVVRFSRSQLSDQSSTINSALVSWPMLPKRS